MIPCYVVTASGGKVYSVDDSATVNDFASITGSGGTAFTPFLLSTLFPLTRTLGFATIRKLRQRFDAPSAVTIQVTPWRDGRDTGQTITRTFGLSDVDITSTPLFYSGSDFQVKLQISGYTAEVQLGNASVSMVPRRHTRGTGVGAALGPTADDTGWTADTTLVTADETIWGVP